MRIAFYTETFYPKIDGIVTRIARTVEQLAELGHDVIIFAPQRGITEFCGFEVVRIPAVPFPPEPEIGVGVLHPDIFTKLRQFRPDIVHLSLPTFVGPMGLISAKLLGAPIVCSYHTNFRMYAIRHGIERIWPIFRAYFRMLYRQGEFTLVTSEPMIEEARAVGMDDVRLWPKAVETDRFHPKNQDDEIRQLLSDGEPEKPLLISAGRLVKDKRLDWLLGPAQEISNIRIAILGEGPERENLEAMFAGTPTIFPGFLSGEKLCQAYASADAFLFPSDTETLGFVAMESMASGTPVVGARAGGIPTVIDHEKNGFLFDPNSREDFLTQTRRLIADSDLRNQLGKQARVDMEACSWRAATEQLVEFYKDALEGRKSS
ncbi:MAG: glycosyltransferase [Verrucomicrobiota bacterium]